MSEPRFVDFNGLAGFMSLGFVQNGMEMVHRTGTLDFGNTMIDSNRHLVGDNWDTSFSSDEEYWRTIPGVEVVMGLPPCSGWSCWTGPSNRGPDAKAHEHTKAFMRYVGRSQPQIAVFECVQQAYTQGRDVMLKYRDMVEEISGLRYDLHHVKMNNLQVNGLSYRPRYFWVAVREGMAFGTESPWPGKVPTIMETIGDLQDMPHTWERQPYRADRSHWIQRLESESGVVDGHIGLGNVHNERIEQMFEYLAMDGQDWDWGEGLSHALKKIYDKRGTLPPLWENKQEKIVDRKFDMGFSLPYRWAGNAWANVLTGGCLDLVVHPTRPRCITHREAARIQGLPDDWKIKPSRDYGPMRDAWGKAVSTDAGRWMGRWVKAALEGTPGADVGELIGDREWLHATDKGFSRQKARARYFPGTKGGVTRTWDEEKWAKKREQAA